MNSGPASTGRDEPGGQEEVSGLLKGPEGCVRGLWPRYVNLALPPAASTERAAPAAAWQHSRDPGSKVRHPLTNASVLAETFAAAA